MWPSNPHLSTTQQKKELISILDAASLAKITSVFLQIRSHGDALYQSRLEPWSEHLTGRQGQPPEETWDPLYFITSEARKRNMKVHAWVNLFRANMAPSRDGLAGSHIANVLRTYCYSYGGYLWMDPGSHQVRRHTMEVIKDIVTRYDSHL